MKTIKIKLDVWKQIQFIKVERDLKTLSDVIEYLLHKPVIVPSSVVEVELNE